MNATTYRCSRAKQAVVFPAVYVASPLTGLTEDQRRQVDAWCKNIEDAILHERTGISEWTLRTHIPAQSSAPWKDSRPDTSIYELNSKLLWTDVDALILICLSGGSLGAGMELAWAGSLMIPALVLVPEGDPVSRQVSGMACEADLAVVPFADAAAMQAAVRRWLTQRRTQLESHDVRRQLHRQRTQSLRAQLVVRWEQVEQQQREEVSRLAGISVGRVERLLADPMNLLAATVTELLALSSALSVELGNALGIRGGALAAPQLVALAQAATEFDWTASDVCVLVERAQSELASSVVRRLPLSSPQDWLRFRERARV